VIVWANKALDRDPQHSFAREALAGAYWKMGDLERGLTYLQGAGEPLPDGTAQPDFGMEDIRLVVQCAEAGDFDAAFEHVQRLIDARDAGSSRRGASVGQLARGSAVQRVSRTDEITAGFVTG
jgi:hypothetical protein